MFVLVVHSPEDDGTPEVHGPFSSVRRAKAYAEEFRRANGLPIEATPENNEPWTELGWYFGIFEPKRVYAIKA
jgi:hypothetical protein